MYSGTNKLRNGVENIVDKPLAKDVVVVKRIRIRIIAIKILIEQEE